MPNQHKDDLFRQIASNYVDAWGQSLQEEQKELEQDSALSLTPRLDRKVLGYVTARKRRRKIGALSALAACLLLVFLLPRTSNTGAGEAYPSAAPSMERNAAADGASPPYEMAGDQALALPEEGEKRLDAQQHLPLPESAPAGDSVAPFSAESPPLLAQDGPIIPLPFELPEHLTILSAEQEGEKSTYLLSSTLSNRIVLTLESTSRTPNTEGLTPLSIDGQTVYTATYPQEQFLTFQKGGILYEMTCPSDLEALIAFSRVILESQGG
ncbi:MAG: hypothetical protein ACOX0K_08235 [Oscillospiraceae bacterium]